MFNHANGKVTAKGVKKFTERQEVGPDPDRPSLVLARPGGHARIKMRA